MNCLGLQPTNPAFLMLWGIWSGYAFESICLKHIPQIKKALDIAGIYSVSSAFYQPPSGENPGFQIDLLIDRKDQVINLFEIKFYNKELSISREYAAALQHKINAFANLSKTKKQLFLVMITAFGVKPNENSLGLVDRVMVMDELFR